VDVTSTQRLTDDYMELGVRRAVAVEAPCSVDDEQTTSSRTRGIVTLTHLQSLKLTAARNTHAITPSSCGRIFAKLWKGIRLVTENLYLYFWWWFQNKPMGFFNPFLARSANLPTQLYILLALFF